MSNRETLLALADRCEREEPSNHLDEDIERACKAYMGSCPVPYTTSLDAAVTLVPEGYRWHGGEGSRPNNLAWARMFPVGEMQDGTGNREAATVPLALCLARLEYEIARKEGA